MNEQIKQRITQLNNGEIPDGYKKTEYGVFPKEWDLVSLNELMDFKNGVNADKEKYNSGVKMISVMDILAESPIYYDNIRGQVDIDEKTLDTYSVTYGDLLFQRSSETFDDAGKSNVYLDKEKTATYSGFVIRGKKKAEYQPYYLNETLRIASSRNQITRNSAGSQHINVGQDSLSKISVPFASKAEQEKIAEILMKWDEAIELQEKYVEKLELRRKSFIQKLFPTRKTDNTIKLGNYLKQCTERNKFGIDNVKSVSNSRGFINQKEQFSKEVASDDVSNYKVVRKGNIAYNPSRINVGSIAIYEDEAPGIVSPMYVVFSCSKITPKFLLLLLETCRGRYEIKSYLSGSVRDSLSFEDLCDIELPFPIFEQERIVKTFELIEENITENNKLLSKMVDQRKALQQYLLNGIVRV